MHVSQRGYGFLVAEGNWRYSFVPKEGSKEFYIGESSTPVASEATHAQQRQKAQQAMLKAGHAIVI